MEEPVVDVVVAKTEPVVAKPEPAETKTEPEPSAPEPKRKGGRPAGAKDKAPRKKKLVIVEQPISKAPVEIEEPPPPPKPIQEPVKPAPVKEVPRHVEPVEHEAPSPRSIIRESARHMLELKRLNESARKRHLQNAYTRRLAAF